MKKLGFQFWGRLPSHLIMLFAFVLPILIVVIVSFSTRGAYGGFEFDFSLKSYQQLLFSEGWTDELEFNPQYLIIIGRTIFLAALTTLITMIIAFPVAYYIARQDARKKALLIYLVTLPFWVSMIVRVYAWIAILGDNGVIEKFLTGIGLIDDMPSLLSTNTATLIGMVYSYIPLMILPLFASVDKLDGALIEASHDLFASKARTLRKIILPLVRPGLASGAILVFVPCLGTVLEPILLGGGKNLMMGNLIQMQFGGARNWPFGAAIAMVLMVLVMMVIIPSARRQSRKNLEDPQ